MDNDLGTLYGVGVGPGDSRLVTVRAVEIIQSAPTVAFPVNREGAASRAYETVKEYIKDGTTGLPLVMPMTKDSQRLAQAHEAAAAALIQAARGGRDVAYLSLGDPLFYSTFGYLAERFPGEVKVISGVAAMSACAAAVGLPLSEGDTPTVVVTGPAHGALESALDMGASIIIMKPRSLSRQSLDLLEAHGAFERAHAAIELGSVQERILQKLDRETAAELPYFSIIWIKPASQICHSEERNDEESAFSQQQKADASLGG